MMHKDKNVYASLYRIRKTWADDDSAKVVTKGHGHKNKS